MSRPQFVLEDDDTEDQRLRSSELPRYSEDSIDELALDRSVFEKDERFRDEGKMEQGEEEEDEFLYGKVPVSETIKIMVPQTDILISVHRLATHSHENSPESPLLPCF